MYIAQGKYRFSTPSETIIDALLQLVVNYRIFIVDNSIKITLTFDGYVPFTCSYSTEYKQMEALKDAVLSQYKEFNIKLYQEI